MSCIVSPVAAETGQRTEAMRYQREVSRCLSLLNNTVSTAGDDADDVLRLGGRRSSTGARTLYRSHPKTRNVTPSKIGRNIQAAPMHNSYPDDAAVDAERSTAPADGDPQGRRWFRVEGLWFYSRPENAASSSMVSTSPLNDAIATTDPSQVNINAGSGSQPSLIPPPEVSPTTVSNTTADVSAMPPPMGDYSIDEGTGVNIVPHDNVLSSGADEGMDLPSRHHSDEVEGMCQSSPKGNEMASKTFLSVYEAGAAYPVAAAGSSSHTMAQHTPLDLLNDLVECACRGTLHMQHSDGKSTLTMAHVGDVYKYLLSKRWPPLQDFVCEYARFAAYLRAQGDATRERVTQAWTNEIHDIKVKQDALTGLLDAYYRKVFRSHQPVGRTQFDVPVLAPEVLSPTQDIRMKYNESMYRRAWLDFEVNAHRECRDGLHAKGNAVYHLPPGSVVLPNDAILATYSRTELLDLQKLCEQYVAELRAVRNVMLQDARYRTARSDATVYDSRGGNLSIAQAPTLSGVETNLAATTLTAIACALGVACGIVEHTHQAFTESAGDDEIKARHKWFREEGVHLKEMKMVRELHTSAHSKVFLVQWKQQTPLVVKDLTLPTDAREADRRVGWYCRLWEKLYDTTRNLTHGGSGSGGSPSPVGVGVGRVLLDFIMPPMDVFWRGPKMKIVTSYAECGSLHDALSEGGSLPEMFTPVLLGRQLLHVVRILHAIDVMHGAISPANVLLNRSRGNVLLNDLGIDILHQGEGVPGQGGLNPRVDLQGIAGVIACVETRDTDVSSAIGRVLSAEDGGSTTIHPEVTEFIRLCMSEGATIGTVLSAKLLSQQTEYHAHTGGAAHTPQTIHRAVSAPHMSPPARASPT